MRKENKHIVIAIVTVIILMYLHFFVGQRRPVQLDSGYRPVMGTFARVIVVAEKSKAAKESIEAAFIEINRVDDLMSDYKDDSEISRINKEAFDKPVEVSQSTFDVLQKSIEFSKLSDGAFDVTVGPLVDLWHAAAEANSIPDEAELSEARSKVGYEKLVLDNSEMTLRFAVEGMRIDLGGIAKGYAIDKAVEAVQAAGAIGAMVDIGGDIRSFGRPSGGKKFWSIGLQNPTKNFEFPVDSDATLLVLKLNDAAVATSGGYRRFVLIEGKKFSHIINRQTGITAEGLSSVTIICQNAIDADALATAVSVLGPEKGLALIERLPQTDAILITPQNEVIKTSSAEKYIK